MEKEFGCDNSKCNHKIVAVAPDDSYVHLYIKPCCKESIKKEYECENCHFVNVRYWCITHMTARIISAKRRDPIDDYYANRGLF